MEIKDNVLIRVTDEDIVDGTFIIPDYITGIADEAFELNYLLKKIIIPNNVIKIGVAAFRDCKGLEEIILSEKLEIIPRYTFDSCQALKKITIPNSVIEIGFAAFRDCRDLEEINFSENLRIIGGSAFYCADSLKKILIPDSVDSIGELCFTYCNELEQVRLPNNLSVIKNKLFAYCYSLEKIEIPDSIITIEDEAFLNCVSLKEIKLPNNLETIMSFAFSECDSLKKIEIPDSVNYIGKYAFNQCNHLKKVKLSKNLKVIKESTFSECDLLKKIEIPNSVNSIEKRAFYNCISLEKIKLSNNLISIGESSFFTCKSLKDVVIPNKVEGLGYGVFESCSSLEQVKLSENLKIIPDSSFNNCTSLKNINIPNNVVMIGEFAFCDCKSLEHISLSENLNKICLMAFMNCCSLKEIKLPDTVVYVGEDAFKECKSLKKIKLSKSMKAIMEYTFADCVSLKFIEIPGNITTIDDGAFNYCKSLEEVHILEGVLSIMESAFGECLSLTKIILPNSLLNIGERAFSDCESLEEIIIPENVRYLESDVFERCTNLKNIKCNSSFTDFEYFLIENLINTSENFQEFLLYDFLLVNNRDSYFRYIHDVRKKELLDKIYNLLVKNHHIYNLKREDLDYFCRHNDNFATFISNILANIDDQTYRNNGYDYKKTLEKFDILFPNTRFSNLPIPEIFKNLDKELASKYNVKIIRELMKLSVFNQTYETKLNIVDVAAVFGLFEKDKDVYSRLNTLKKLFELNLYLSEEDFYRISIFKEYYNLVERNVYILKENVTIPEELEKYLKEVMYDYNLLILKKLDKRIGKFANDFFKENYILTKQNYYHLIQNIEPNILMEIYEEILNSKIRNQITVESLNRIFNNSPKKYNEKALNFIVKYFKLILSDEEYQSKVRDILINYNEIEIFYKSKGNNNFNFLDAIEYLDNISFTNINEGNYEFAQLVKNAGITSQEKFEKYQELYETMKIRRLSNIPRVNEELLINVDDKSYKVGIEILRKDDPFALLVGEVKYTNCCQRLDDVGEPCMLHSINDGRIFCTYLIDENNNKILLSESWIWRCGNMICFDNIEGTSIMKESQCYKDIVAACYKLVSERIVNVAKENNDRIEVISIGKGYDDLGLENYFDKKSDNELRPKNYDSYSDSHLIYYVIGNQDMIDECIFENKIYTDERRISLQSGFNVSIDTISKIKRIEQNHKEEMRMYEDVSNINELASTLETNAENINILFGEDWYYIYSVENEKIKIHDLVKDKVMFKGENTLQLNEIRKAFYEILKKSIIVENDNIIVKEIEADLREDTSYILFLKQVKDGNIILLEENAYDYETEENIDSKYENPLKHIKEIRNNDRIIMHKVRFKISDKLIEVNNSKKYTK